jgi:hypothetical protein
VDDLHLPGTNAAVAAGGLRVSACLAPRAYGSGHGIALGFETGFGSTKRFCIRKRKERTFEMGISPGNLPGRRRCANLTRPRPGGTTIFVDLILSGLGD